MTELHFKELENPETNLSLITTPHKQNHRFRRRAGMRNPSTYPCLSYIPKATSHRFSPYLILCICLLLQFSIHTIQAELVRELDVSEGVPVGHQIGYIGEQLPGVNSGPPYLIVPVPGSGVDTDLAIDHTTGEIRTKVRLDRETRVSYTLVAIPLSGENVRVLIRVHDENDNSPTFPASVMNIEFPENTPRDVKRTLHPARDLDLGRYNTQRYNIVSGNTNNAFRLSSHRERDGVLYLDLQINGFLDRETTPFYSLVIEALDGGTPPLRGQMTVNITIQDVNDNQPIFNQSRYFATVAENATVATPVVQVYATDADADENGLVEYSINHRQSDKEHMFEIDSKTGWITVNKPLDFETRELHELVVVAKDHGETPLETTTFVSIRVTDVNDNQPTINVIFLSDDATPKISESAEPGDFVARISVHDPDSKTEYANVNVTLNGGDGHFGLTTRDNIIYLVIVNMTLDRESTPNYTLSVVATDNGTPPLHASKTIYLRVTDINDNAPEFDRPLYEANVMEISDPGTSILQVYAYDRDEGNNSAVTYSLVDTPDTHSQWFQIDMYTGVITTRTHIDCETEPVPQLTVVANDNGHPPLSSNVTVLVTIHDVNDNEPIFDQSYYNVTVAENEAKGRCILKVSANDPDCGVNAMVTYTMGSTSKAISEFEVRSSSGEICIAGDLDYERKNVYEFPVVATDRGGLSTTAIIKIQLSDINDNRPTFYPSQYKVSLRESSATSSSSTSSSSSPLSSSTNNVQTSIVTVTATDPDSGRFGALTYRIVGGNDASAFRIDRATGEIFVNRPNLLSTRTQSQHVLNVSASDGGGLRTQHDALVYANIIDATQRPPIFEKLRYNFYVKEDVMRGTVVGTIQASSTDAVNRNAVHYSIYAGDNEGYFSIDENSGNIRVANSLDREVKGQVMLNVQASMSHTSHQGYTQVNIIIEDVNDNAPEFETNIIRISVPENFDLAKPLYAAYANDRDSGKNAEISYILTMLTTTDTLNNVTMSSMVGIGGGGAGASSLTLSSQQNNGLSSLMQQQPAQVQNNQASVSKSSSHGHQTSAYGNIASGGGNGGIGNANTNTAAAAVGLGSKLQNLFTIDARSGHLTLSRHLDYETSQRHTLIVTAMDAGQPRLSSNLTIVVEVQDVNDNPPEFERNEYHVKVLESMPVNSQIVQVTAIDADTGNNARITYRILPLNNNGNQMGSTAAASSSGGGGGGGNATITNNGLNIKTKKLHSSSSSSVLSSASSSLDAGSSMDTEISQIFGIYPNSGWIYLRSPVDRETRDHYELHVVASDNGSPPAQASTRVMVRILDANDNDPRFLRSSYEFSIEENMSRGSLVGIIGATDLDLGENAAIRYSLVAANNSSFQVNPLTGEITTREPLDRELHSIYDLVAEARDQGTPYRSSRVTVKVHVTDVNDNQPKIVDPQEDVVSVREEQPPGTVVVRIRAVDRDNGQNASITYSILKGRDSDGFGLFSIDANTGVIRTLVVLDHEERSIYRLAVAATDGGNPPKQSIRLLRVEVLNLNDNRPTFTSSSLVFRVSENVRIGHIVGYVDGSDGRKQNMIFHEDNLYITYTLAALSKDVVEGVFDIDRHTGSLVVARQLDREEQSEYRLEVRALDTSASNNPQSSAIAVKIEITDINDNAPIWLEDPIGLQVSELMPPGSVLYNFTATDIDMGLNGQVQYKLLKYTPKNINPVEKNSLNTLEEQDLFAVDILTGGLTLMGSLDYEMIKEYILIVQAFDLAENKSERLHSTVTAVVKVLDENDNDPEFVIPPVQKEMRNRYGVPSKVDTPTSLIYISDNRRIGDVLLQMVAIDKDSGNNGRISYILESGNELGYFRLNPDSGSLELVKSLPPHGNSGEVESHGPKRTLNRNKFELVVKAQDHGRDKERRSSLMKLQILVRGTKSNPPRFTQSMYYANISEKSPTGSFVLEVKAKSLNGGENANLTYEIPTGVADNHFHVDTQRGIVTTRGQFDRETKASYILPIYVYDAKRSKANLMAMGSIDPSSSEATASALGMTSVAAAAAMAARRQQRSSVNEAATAQNGQFDVATLHITITDVNDHAPEFRPGSCYALSVPENSDLAVIHTIVATDLDEGANGEIVYTIIGGNTGNKFSLDMHSGELTARPLDREQQSRYILQIQASDRGSPNSYQGHCNITILVEDQNDNDPHFEQPKYVTSIAEDVPIGTSVLRIKALDDDLGVNARLLYTLANETQWQFAIDNKSGVITTVGPLDRERQHIYNFMVVATDGGRYDSRSARVPVQISIDDVNDNKPIFERYPFRAHVPALIQPGQTLVQVTANDKDLGLNGEIIYSLKEQDDPSTRGKFRINPNTGVVSASQSLASESGRLLHLEVMAHDKGQPSMSTQGLIELLIGEFPQGSPTLRFQNDTYRMKIKENSSEGLRILQVNALRSDGRRTKLMYSFGTGNENGALKIDSITGEIKVARSEELDYERYAGSMDEMLNANRNYASYRGRSMLYEDEDENATPPSSLEDGNEDSKTFRNNRALRRREMDDLPVLLASAIQPHELRFMLVAQSESHSGAIPLYAYAELILELEDVNDNSPVFTQSQYASTVWEGNNKGTFVVQVSAFDQDAGTNSRILYHIVDGNHDNAFVIEPAFSGIVKTNIVLDREIRDMYKLKVIATDEGVPQMTGTATIRVHIVDVNDNQPTFPPHSVITVGEGTELGSVITTISANDVDTYPALTYRFGMDMPDQHHHHHHHEHNSDDLSVKDDIKSIFAIDRYSGKVVLKRHLDYEQQQEYQLEIIASDAAHEARCTLTVRVGDENDNAPIFEQPAYFAMLPDLQLTSSAALTSDIELLRVNATDLDSEENDNSKVVFSIDPEVKGFTVNEQTGAVYVNVSRLAGPNAEGLNEDLFVTVVAKDKGSPSMQSSTTLRVQVQGHNSARAQFLQSHYRTHINENAPLGSVVLKLSQDILDANTDFSDSNLMFTIVSGNEEGRFKVFQSQAIILVKPLDREQMDLYKLRLVISDPSASPQQLASQAAENSTSAINVFVSVDDWNDNAPRFANTSRYEAEVSELAPLRYSIAQLQALDMDADNTPNSEVVYEIMSGNDEGMFTIDLVSGVLFVNNKLDYDTGSMCYELIIRACDSASQPLCSLKSFRLSLKDENDNSPVFPVSEFIEFVAENEPVGTSVFKAHATDLDRGEYGLLNYTIEHQAVGSDDIAWKLFRVDSNTGIISTNSVFDFEQRNRFDFLLRAMDSGGKSSKVKVRIQIDSRDEYAPQFTERTYRFVMPSPSSGYLPLGYIVGQVSATDRDKGPDGRVVYQLSSQHAYFKVNRTTGAVVLKKKLDDNFDDGRDISLVISASSGRQGSLTNMTVVEISLDPLADPGTNLASSGGIGSGGSNSGGLADWILGLIIALMLVVCAAAGIFLFIRMRSRKPRNVVKPHLNTEPVGNSNSYVDPSAFDTIPIRASGLNNLSGGNNNPSTSGAMASAQFAPPKYDEIPPYGNHAGSSNSGAATTSELSGSEQSGSSGRGSAEDDGEDEEIRMINEGNLRAGAAGEDGRLSDISVQNTQEYLARLGIVDRDNDTNGGASTTSMAGSNKEAHIHHPLPMVDSLHMYAEDPNAETDITNLIYAKLNDVNGAASDRASSNDEAAAAAAANMATAVMGYSNHPGVNGANVGPSMTGSLSSIVHSEEELKGSYNWDYLLDWGPQYQPLAHVFSEIARLKDDNVSVNSGQSGGSSSNKSKQSLAHSIASVVKTRIPPPMLTNVAPRAINLQVLSGSGVNMRMPPNSGHHMTGTATTHLGSTPQYILPRSPINHETAGGFSTSSAMSPSFSPSLSPLATRSPSISPLGGHHMVNMPRHQPQATQRTKNMVEQIRM
ncbi:dachsous cadherin-related 1 [Haematobia irritans]|uniref:dachsous cadherin-related 1 n=1 Tax=Haematobia irritans TaxID=7368 RepID=UPI003F4FB44D